MFQLSNIIEYKRTYKFTIKSKLIYSCDVDAFSHFVATVPVKQNNAQNVVNSLLHHWITKFRPPIYFVTDRGSEYNNSKNAILCTTMENRHSPRTPYSP